MFRAVLREKALDASLLLIPQSAFCRRPMRACALPWRRLSAIF